MLLELYVLIAFLCFVAAVWAVLSGPGPDEQA
jgi:hypothetical protein